MKNEINVRFNLIAIILIIIFCFAISPVALQNDTFYTIKIGEYVLQNGITMQDPFSFHQGLKYTYPHWAYDVMIYLFYNLGGQTGVYLSTIILCSILGIALYLANSKLTKNNLVSFMITIGAMYCLKDFIAARAQLFTFILFAFTIYFIEMFLESKKKRYAIFLIIIPILIANFHLAVFPFYFILYLPYIAEYLISLLSSYSTFINKIKINKINKLILKNSDEKKCEELEKRIIEIKEREEIINNKRNKLQETPYKIKIKRNNNIKYLILILIICLFTGFLTPLGTTPYTYLYNTMQGNTTQNISEHLALILINNTDFICVIILFLSLLTFTDTKIRLSDLFMISGLLLLAFYTRRQTSMFIIIGSFVLNRLICDMFNKYDPEGSEKIKGRIIKPIGLITTIALVLIISVPIYKPKIDDDYIDKSSYPVEATEYILNNLDVKNIKLYNEYNYGSYLLFKNIPVFIDSRADLYSPEFNEGANIFSDFLDISGLNINNVEEKLDEYGITHLIMYSNAKLRTFIKQNKDEYKQLYDDGHFCLYERL